MCTVEFTVAFLLLLSFFFLPLLPLLISLLPLLPLPLLPLLPLLLLPLLPLLPLLLLLLPLFLSDTHMHQYTADRWCTDCGQHHAGGTGPVF